MTLYTIGFTRRGASAFFSTLREARVTRLLDVRVNNTSQLAGFTRRDDLAYFCDSILGIPYVHVMELAPTRAMLDRYRAGRDWQDYEREYTALIEHRRVQNLERDLFDGACLLCSEPEPVHCHRRVAAEYLQRAWGDVAIVHL
jgi:uncharacterized protein (DUF488 family)